MLLVQVSQESLPQFRVGNGTIGTDVARLGCGNAQQTVTVTASDGTFTLAVNGVATDAIAHDAAATDVETALEAVVGDGNVAVSGDAGGPWTVDFLNAEGGNRQAAIVADSNDLHVDGSVTVEVTQEGAEGVNEQQTVMVDATSGHFGLTFGAETTEEPIAFDAAAADVQAALEALTGIGVGNVAVLGDAGGPWLVEFQGALAAQDVATLASASVDLRDGMPSIVVTVVAPGNDVGGVVRKYVVVRADNANGNVIKIGTTVDNADDGFILSAGQQSPPIYVDDLNKVYLVGGAAGQNYSWIAC